MARILTEETTLTRKRRALKQESGLLARLAPVEMGLGAVLLVAGIALYLIKGSAFLAVIGGVVFFFGLGHRLKVSENDREIGFVGAGIKGEVTVTQMLQRGLPADTYILNDLNVKHGSHGAQIDHLVVSPKGLFVLETKNWRGDIEGDEREPRWTQIKPNQPPVTVSNPILQNQRHIDVLRGFLQAAGVDWLDLHSLVVMMSQNSTWRIDNRTVPVLTPQKAVDFIKEFVSDRVYSEAEIDKVLNLFVRPS